MKQHLTILNSPTGEEFYEAYGPMTKDRSKATRFFTNPLTLREPTRFGNTEPGFWTSEREAAEKARREFRGWTFRIEPVAPHWATNDTPPSAPHFQGQIYDEDTGKTVAVTYDDEGGHKARLIASAPALRESLEEAERIIRWAAQEARGRVKAELVGGWLHHANKIRETLNQ